MGLKKLKKETLVELVTLLAKQKSVLEDLVTYGEVQVIDETQEELDSAQERIAQIEIGNGINLDEL